MDVEKCVVCGSTDLKNRPYSRLWCSYDCAIADVKKGIAQQEAELLKAKEDLAIMIKEKERKQLKYEERVKGHGTITDFKTMQVINCRMCNLCELPVHLCYVCDKGFDDDDKILCRDDDGESTHYHLKCYVEYLERMK